MGTLTELNKLGRDRGQFAATLAMEGLLKKRERAREHAAKQAGRDIPTSGSGRRRAKAKRNQGQCLAMLSDGTPCQRMALRGIERCNVHLDPMLPKVQRLHGGKWTRTRGKQYETDQAQPDTGWVPVYT